MKKNSPSFNRVLHDPDARRFHRLKHLNSILLHSALLAGLALLSHFDVIWKRKQFETSQMIFLGVSLLALCAILFSVAQLRCITKMTDKKES